MDAGPAYRPGCGGLGPGALAASGALSHKTGMAPLRKRPGFGLMGQACQGSCNELTFPDFRLYYWSERAEEMLTCFLPPQAGRKNENMRFFCFSFMAFALL